jgi:outer membrane biosynthesis protein TonB
LPRYHAISAGGTAFVALFVCALAVADYQGVGGCGGAAADNGPDLTKLEAIEVSVARPAKPAKQPQKQHREAVHQADQGVAHHDDPIKPPPDKKKKPDDQQPKPDDNKDQPTAKIDDTDDPLGKPTSDIGQFNPNKFGNADVDKGDPYLRDIVKDVLAGWEFPKILDASGVPTGCVHLDADGKVIDTKFKQKSGNEDLDDSVDRALEAFKKARNQDPKPVPPRLMDITTEWVCFDFKLQQ